MSWNPAQQAMLEAMGYTLWRHAGAGAPAAPPESAVDRHAAPVAPGSATRGVASAAPGPASATGIGSGGAEALLKALQRAAGGADLSSVALPPLASLRGDARAKRALWPQLRALRRR